MNNICEQSYNVAPNKKQKRQLKTRVMITIQDYIKQIHEEAKSREGAAMRHYEAGKRDCQAGIYDKWYRYNTANDGMAYDLGWTEQNKETKNGVVRFLDA
ncbi:MAG: hypothetical protein MR037_02600 [Bacteroidales bacterium]|nr:hypothetical protein [Bacteroidales bacterium]